MRETLHELASDGTLRPVVEIPGEWLHGWSKYAGGLPVYTFQPPWPYAVRQWAPSDGMEEMTVTVRALNAVIKYPAAFPGDPGACIGEPFNALVLVRGMGVLERHPQVKMICDT